MYFSLMEVWCGHWEHLKLKKGQIDMGVIDTLGRGTDYITRIKLFKVTIIYEVVCSPKSENNKL